MNKAPFDESADWIAIIAVGLLALILFSGFHCEVAIKSTPANPRSEPK